MRVTENLNEKGFNLKHIFILGVKVSVTNLQTASLFIEDCIRRRKKTYVCIAPVSTIVDVQSNDRYKDIVNNSGMTTPDGMPLVWLGKLKGERGMERTYGPDLMAAFCQFSQDKGYRHYFFGGHEASNQLLISKLKERFPRINIVGNFSPSFREIGEREEASVIEAINQASPDVLWVGLGSPKQDYWMREHRDKLDAPVMVGVGAAFDFLAGVKKQAPVWMRRIGMEWFFRLCCEPRRLWRRYLVGNTLFIYWLLKDFFQSKLRV